MSKDVNVELNLTPFIGLFAMLVVLLLLTAVWNQVEALSTNSSSTTASDSPPPPDQKKQVQLSITILEDKVQMAEDQKPIDIPIVNQEIDYVTMNQYLKEWRIKYPDKKDIVLNTDNKTPYRHLILTFDNLVGEGWPDVGVSTQ